MKLLIKYNSSIFCSLIRAEEIEIKSNKISVSQLKEQISIKFKIPKCDIILTIKYENNKNNKKSYLITLSDEFPLFYFFIHNNMEILLEKRLRVDKNREIFEKIKYSKKREYRFLKKLNLYNYSLNFNNKKNLAIIKESENEYTEIEEKNNKIKEESDSKLEQIINQAIEFIILDKVVQFNEYIFINDFIQENMSVLTNKENGWNALHYSCFYGREKMTQNLIKLYNPSKELINGITKEGYTPLHLACIKGHINIIKILLFLKDIDVNIKSEIEGTPLHIACEKNNMQIVSILVSYKADLYIKNSKNKLPIELTTDENIKKILQKSMQFYKDDDINIIQKNTELDLYTNKFFNPLKPPISIGNIEKRGFLLPIYEKVFIEVNPIIGYIRKYKFAKDYPDNYYEKIDLNLVKSCTREFPKDKEVYYFSVIYSHKEIFRVKNEEAFNRWIKIINESIIFCKTWKRIEKMNKNAQEYLNKQKNVIEIIEENGEIKNYEDEQRKKEEEIMEKDREEALKELKSGQDIIDKKNENNNGINNTNTGKNINKNKKYNITYNINSKQNLDIKILNDAGKKGINMNCFEIIELMNNYTYGRIYKVKLKEKIIHSIPDINLYSKEILVLKTINKKEMNRLNQLKNIEEEINISLNLENPFIQKIIFSFQDNKYIYIVERFCLGGNLKWHINLSLFEEQEAKYYIAELILAIEYLHKKNIFCKNLSSEKILINKNNHIQLMNYGLIQVTNINNNEEKSESNDLTSFSIDNFFFTQEENVSNELNLMNPKEAKEEDIYGIGVVLYELVCGTKPFYSKENMNLFKDDFKKDKLIINDYFSKHLKNLLNKLLSKDKNEKFNNLEEIKKHEFFKDFNWNQLIKLEIVPPNNLVKNRIENWNKVGFKKLKSGKKEYFLDFNIVTNSQNISLISKYFENTNNDEYNKEKLH